MEIQLGESQVCRFVDQGNFLTLCSKRSQNGQRHTS